jgi:hypothetical protein
MKECSAWAKSYERYVVQLLPHQNRDIVYTLQPLGGVTDNLVEESISSINGKKYNRRV